jgi:hypothetical protein
MIVQIQPTVCPRCGRPASEWHVSDVPTHDYRVKCGPCRRFVGWKTEEQLAIQRTIVHVSVIPLREPGPTLDEFFT